MFRFYALKILFFVAVFLQVVIGKSTAQSSWDVNGYISNMQSIMSVKGVQFTAMSGSERKIQLPCLANEKYWLTENLIHNRINVKWYASSDFTMNIEIRNRFFYGDQLPWDFGNVLRDSYGMDMGLLDLSFNLFSGNSYLWNTIIDRLYLDYNHGSFNITIGRQRINWGQGFVWNPNDVFNVYSFFDFDYVERPGSDAIRVQYFPNYTSSIEIAAKVDHNQKITLAALGKVNIASYDVQFLTGLLNDEDWFIGTGWSGNISSLGFTGEASYFHPKNSFHDTTGILLSSIGLNYTFSNSLMIQAEFLYNQQAHDEAKSFFAMYSGDLNVKNSSISKTNYFASVSYPISPLFNASISGMYLTDLDGWFLGPTLSYSLSENLDVSMILQYFEGKIEARKEDILLGFMRLKWNF